MDAKHVKRGRFMTTSTSSSVGGADLPVAQDPFEPAEQDEGDVQHGGDPERG